MLSNIEFNLPFDIKLQALQKCFQKTGQSTEHSHVFLF